MSGHGESVMELFSARIQGTSEDSGGWRVRLCRVFGLNRPDSVDVHIERNFNQLSGEHVVEAKKIIIVDVVLLKSRRGTSRMESDVRLSIRRTYPFG